MQGTIVKVVAEVGHAVEAGETIVHPRGDEDGELVNAERSGVVESSSASPPATRSSAGDVVAVVE